MAQNQGTSEAGRQAKAAGLNVRKVWTLGPNPCELCQDAAAEGDIDLDADFGDEAGNAPPLHPNCECNLDLFVADEEEEAKMQDDDSDDDHLDANGGNGDRHVVDTLADLIAEAGTADGKVTRQDALRWLLHSPHGAALIARVARGKRASNRKKDSTMTRTQTLTRIVKQAGGLGPLCQKIVKRGSADVTEAELTGMITAAAKHEFPHLDDARAFTKLYASSEVLRRAVQIAQATPVGGDDNGATKKAAYAKLQMLAEQYRAHNSHLSPEQSFAKVFADPANKALAELAHQW
jgi:hypothetical protein